MCDPAISHAAFAELPQCLGNLIERELQAGNRILEIGRTRPAPPDGLCIRLAKRVSTRARRSSDDMKFYERISHSHDGQFSDAQFKYFVVEPPGDPAVELDMNAIRAELDARERAANADRFRDCGWRVGPDPKQQAADTDRFGSGLW